MISAVEIQPRKIRLFTVALKTSQTLQQSLILKKFGQDNFEEEEGSPCCVLTNRPRRTIIKTFGENPHELQVYGSDPAAAAAAREVE